MRLCLGKYIIQTDDNQFIVKEVRTIQASKLTKEENIGKVVEKDIAYCSTFENALKFVSRRVFIDYDDIKDVIKETKLLQSKIEGLTKLFDLNGGRDCE